MTVLTRDQKLDAISLQARELRPGVALVGFIAAVLMGFGRMCGGVINGFAWVFVAIREGYRDARSPERAPNRSGGAG